MTAEARVPQRYCDSYGQHDRQPDAGRQQQSAAILRRPQQIVQPGDRRFDTPLVGEALRGAAHQQHRAERHDERDNPEARDQQSRHGSADRARANRTNGRQRRPAARAQQQRQHYGAQRDDRSDGQVDPAGDDHHRHAERRDAHDDRLARHQLDIGGAEELRPDDRACAPDSIEKIQGCGGVIRIQREDDQVR